MNKTPLLLLGLFLIAGAGAWYLARTDAPIKGAVSEPLSAVLQESINSVRKITIRSGAGEIVLEGYGSEWVVANRSGYPALFGQVKELLINLSEARIIEYKTSNAELYERLGLVPLDQEGARSHQVVVEDGTGKTMLDVIIGDQSTGAISGYYAKHSDNARSFLVDGELSIDADMRNWLDAELADIDSDRVREILIRQDGEQPLRIYKEDDEQQDFTLADIPEDQEIISQTTLNRMGTILAALSAEDVASKDSFSFSEAAIKTQVHTFDGLVGDITAEYTDGKAYATIAFTADEEIVKATVIEDGEEEGSTEFDDRLEKVRQEAARLNAKFDDWLYEVPYFKYDTFDRKPGGLLSEIKHSSGDDSDAASAPAQ
ncbi:MAG: DUF4340 domain-containing protein [Candidatus Porifericomitaceae bacterium WSBS_2022_MAG_OTU9]